MPKWFTSLLKTAAEKLFGEVVNWKKLAALLSGGAATFAVLALSFLRGTYPVRGWLIAAVFAYVIVVTVFAVTQLYWAIQRQRAFRETRVQDSHFGLEWRLRMDPEDWTHTPVREYAPDFLKTIVAGPFHLAENGNCSAEVSFVVDPATGTLARPFCMRCELTSYRERYEYSEEVANLARALVAMELERRYRNGERLSGAVVKLDHSGGSNFLARPRRKTG